MLGRRETQGPGLMLIVHAYIEVAELEAGIRFYCEGLGLSLKRRLSASWVELEGASLPVFLLGNRPPLADLDAAVSRLTGFGAVLDRPIQHREYGRMANMADPFGNGFDLIEFSGDGYEAVSR